MTDPDTTPHPTAPAVDPDTLSRFIAIYAGLPGRIVVASDVDGFTGHFHTTDPAGRTAAAQQILTLAQRGNVYLRTTTVTDTFTPTRPGERGGAADSAAAVGIVVDLDHRGGHHKRGDLPPDPSACLELLHGLPAPTLLIDSGGGLYGWWLFDTPAILTTPDDVAAVEALTKGWNRLIGVRARARGWHVDNVGDLARIVRPPGTLNRKGGDTRPVHVTAHTGQRYTRDQLQAIVDELSPAQPVVPLQPSRPAVPAGDSLVDDIKNSWTVAAELGHRGIVIGRDRKLRCPFPGHNDGSPSFHVYDDRDAGWACYGSSCPSNRNGSAGGGSVIDLVMWLDNVDTATAITILAPRIGRVAPHTGPTLIPAPSLPPGAAAAAAQPEAPLPYKAGTLPLNDLGNARRFKAAHGHDSRYVYAFKSWLAWNGQRWVDDAGGIVEKRGQAVIEVILREALAMDPDARMPLVKWAKSTGNSARLRAMLEVGRPLCQVDVDQLDTRPWELNTPSGIVDLRTGRLEPHDRERFHTKITGAPYQPDAQAPTWQRFLGEVLPDPDVRGFFQRLAGAAAAGVIAEHVLPILWGPGSNGKSTAVEIIMRALGMYARPIGVQALLDGKRNPDAAAPEIAGLRGIRLAVGQEPELGARLRESTVKHLTGGDRIVARRLYQDPIEFDPTHSLWVVTNHKPVIRGVDEGIWRRIVLVPWDVIIPADRRDRTLPARLAAELPGILHWIVQGAVAWAHAGLQPPAAVQAATSGYRAESDRLQPWIEDRCVLADDARAEPAALYGDYETWCKDTAEDPVAKHTFYTMLTERGFEAVKWKGRRLRRGIRLDAGPQQESLGGDGG